MRQAIFIISAILFCISCKKNNKTPVAKPVETEPLIMSYGGRLSIYNPISFGSNQPDSVKFEWDFGDGSKSIQAKPVRLYSNAGSYKITLRINNDTSRMVTGTITITNGLERFTKVRNWTKKTYNAFDGPGGPHYNNERTVDTGFALSIPDSNTITVPGDNSFPSFSTSVSMKGTSKKDSLWGYITATAMPNENSTLNYYPAKDSMRFLRSYYLGSDSYQVLEFISKAQ